MVQVSVQSWRAMKPDLRRALAAKLAGTQDSAAIDRVVSRISAAASSRPTGLPCSTGLCVSPRPTGDTGDTGEVRVGTDGYVHGIDGLLDQLSGALMRQVRTEILPELMRDRTAVVQFGEACGRGAAQQLGGWVKVSAALSAAVAALAVYDRVRR